MIAKGPVTIQQLIAWSNYEDDLRDYTIEIFDSKYESEKDFDNPDREPVIVKLSNQKIDEVKVIEPEIWNG